MALIEACVIGDVDLVSKILSDLDVNINDEASYHNGFFVETDFLKIG